MNAGDTIGSYQLDSPLDLTSRTIWRVKHMVSNQAFRMDVWPMTGDRTGYVQAMKIVAGLRHPHIASILEFGVHGETHGGTLSRYIPSDSVDQKMERDGQHAFT